MAALCNFSICQNPSYPYRSINMPTLTKDVYATCTRPAALKTSDHLRYIDSLRGIAIFAVIFVHVGQVSTLPGLAGRLSHFGAAGVQLFYTISALTLFMSMSKRTGVERHPKINFFIRRFFRIAPAFYLILLVCCLLGNSNRAVQFEVSHIQISGILFIMSFLNGWRPDLINFPVTGQWSITVEMMFYLLLPFLFTHVRTFHRAVLAWYASVAILLFSPTFALHLASAEGFDANTRFVRDFSFWWFPNQLPVFMSGIGLYFIVKERLIFTQYISPYLPGTFVVLAACVATLHQQIFVTPLFGILFMIGTAYLAENPTHLFVNRFSAFLGKISFSAYLFHPLVLRSIKPYIRALPIQDALAKFLLTFALTFILTCPISWLMWAAVEVPFQRLGRTLIGWWEEPNLPVFGKEATDLSCMNEQRDSRPTNVVLSAHEERTQA